MVDCSARLGLAGTLFADVRWLDEVESTNQAVTELARAGAAEGVVVVADHQTAGRGRMGRQWHAPPKSSLLASVLLRPALPHAHVPLTTLAMALAAADACAEVADVQPQLKWPNDVVVGEQKLGGILGETVLDGGDLAVAVGIGLNVNWGAEAPPAPGAALDQLTGHLVDRAALLVALLRNLERRYHALSAVGGTGALLADYRARSATLGRRVRLELGAGAVEGVATDVTPQGHLVVDGGGEVRVVTAGDVVHLRPLP